jgi:KDO2-lipid IV(A) lauroyltransferase
VPDEGDGVYAPFFGRPAYTITLVQKLQQVSGAPVVTIGVERLGFGRGYRFHAVPMAEAMSTDPVIAATQMNRALEDMIRKMPLQYLWGYNRYRKPRPARPPVL